MPHKKKATTEEIIRVIHAYLSEEIELKDAAQQLQVHTSTIRMNNLVSVSHLSGGRKPLFRS